MNGLRPVRFETGRPMLMVGLRQRYALDQITIGVPALWERFQDLGNIHGRVGTETYGIMCGFDAEAGTLEYMCGAEVSELSDAHGDLGRLRIQEQEYAIFAHDGHMSSLPQTWDAIVNEWLPRSSYETAHAPDFECYDSRFDPATGRGGIEVWVAVVEAR